MAVDLESEFPINRERVFLDHAAVAPWPRRSERAVARFAEEACALGPAAYERWEATERRLRESLARLVGAASPDRIALVKSTSEALSVVAHGLRWEPGDLVLIPEAEFPSNRIVWESLRDQGVRLRALPLPPEDPEAALLAAIRAEAPRLLSASAVQYGTGLRLDLERLGRACREHGVLFCVDAIQAVGAMPFDVEAWGVDFAMADGHKWMLGPEGLGLLYVAPEQLAGLTLRQYGWHMVEALGDFERLDWAPARTARRFECGSPNLLAAHALEASTGLLLEHGLARVEEELLERCAHLAAGLRRLGAEILSPSDARRSLGILTFRLEGRDARELAAALRAEGVACACRGGGVRLSPHFHTPRRVLDRALETVSRVA